MRPMIEGLEGRQMLSTAARATIIPQAISLTSTERGTYSVRVERSSPLIERFQFNGSGMIPGLGPVRVRGWAFVKEDLAQAGTVTGKLVLTSPGHGGATTASISEPIPAHTGSSPLLPFRYAFSGGTGRFRRGFDSGTGTLTRTSTTPVPRGAKGGFIVQVFSDRDTGLVAGQPPRSTAAAPTRAVSPAAAPPPGAAGVDPTGVVNPVSPSNIPAPQGLLSPTPVNTLTVTNLNDSGVGSLRSQLGEAHDGDTINFDPSLKGTITLTSGELQVGRSVSIEGPGSAKLSISGNNATRVLEVLTGADVSIQGLTITNGVANAPGSGVNLVGGGGIFVAHDSTLTLTGSVVTGNIGNSTSASDKSPGLVAGTGGGIFNAGTLTLSDDLIWGNTANTGSALDVIGGQVNAAGGGIFNRRDATLTLVRTAVMNNTANAGASSSLTARRVAASSRPAPWRSPT
jgi:hypothetical protein